MLKRSLAILLLSTCAAFAQSSSNSYLPLASVVAAQSRAAQMCVALGCTGNTIYWWGVQPTTDGAASVVIGPTGTAYGPTTTIGPCAVGCGLSSTEQAALQTAAQMGTKLPWVISYPTFEARWSPTEISAMAVSTDPLINPEWSNLKAAATVDLSSAALQTMVNEAVTNGIITAANAQTILTYTAVAAVPP